MPTQALQIEPNVILAHNFTDDAFREQVSDLRYSEIRYNTFGPLEAIADQDSFAFEIPAKFGNNEIRLQEMILSVGVKLRINGTTAAPSQGMQISFVNNIFHSLFKSVEVTFGPDAVSTNKANTSNYRYKAYLINLLSYDTSAKAAHLQCEGWYDDQPGFWDPTSVTLTQCTGWTSRRNLFTKPATDNNPHYLRNETVFSARLIF